jgi:hypothetical protein
MPFEKIRPLLARVISQGRETHTRRNSLGQGKENAQFRVFTSGLLLNKSIRAGEVGFQKQRERELILAKQL